MEPQIKDYYNELPDGINVIDKMNEELEEAQKEIETLKKKEEKYDKVMKKFQMPRIKVDSVEEYKEYDRKLEEFGEFCKNSFENGKLPNFYNEDSCGVSIMPWYEAEPKKEEWLLNLIKELDKLTNHQNIDWCRYRINMAVNEFKKQSNNIYEGYFKGQIQLLTIYDKYKDNI